MPRIIQTAILDAPVTRAYKIVSDVERYPEFFKEMRNSRFYKGFRDVGNQ